MGKVPGSAALLAAVLALQASEAAHAEGKVRRESAPAWVDELPVPMPRAERLRQVEDGRYTLLADWQLKSDGTHEIFYKRTVEKVTSREGLENAARIDIDFDPTQQDVILHRIRILRDGKSIDRLSDARVEVLRRETDLDEGILDGSKTVHIEISDVRVGDSVDIAFSLDSERQLWPGNFFDSFGTSWSVPIGLERYKLIWLSAVPLTIRNYKTNISPTIVKSGGATVYQWRLADPEPIPEEVDTPDWDSPWGSVGISSMASWKDVVAWALPFWQDIGDLPPELASRADEISHKFEKPEDRVTEAVRLVQDEIRYVSLAMGSGSYRPRKLGEIVRSGFGDCKDKTALLVALLHRLNVQAFPALTDSDSGPGLPMLVPAPGDFDHAIVQIRLGGKSYWVDPTRSYEGGRFPALAALPYAWALPLVAGQASLAPIANDTLTQPDITTTEKYEFAAKQDGEVVLTVHTRYLGDKANWIRGDIAEKSPSVTEKNYFDYYNNLYPGLKEGKPLRIIDDREGNRIDTIETYLLQGGSLIRESLAHRFPIKASSISDLFNDDPDQSRKTSFQLPYPTNKLHTIVLVTPGSMPTAPDPVQIDDAGFHYGLDVARKEHVLTLTWSIRMKKQVLSPPEVPSFRRDRSRLIDADYWYIDVFPAAVQPVNHAMRNVLVFLAIVLGLPLVAFRWIFTDGDALRTDPMIPDSAADSENRSEGVSEARAVTDNK